MRALVSMFAQHSLGANLRMKRLSSPGSKRRLIELTPACRQSGKSVCRFLCRSEEGGPESNSEPSRRGEAGRNHRDNSDTHEDFSIVKRNDKSGYSSVPGRILASIYSDKHHAQSYTRKTAHSLLCRSDAILCPSVEASVLIELGNCRRLVLRTQCIWLKAANGLVRYGHALRESSLAICQISGRTVAWEIHKWV